MTDNTFFPPQSRVVLGLVVVLVSGLLAFLRWYSVKGPLETLAWVEQHRAPGDSATYASALYHASHAQAAHKSRWSATGYAAHGVAGAVIGLTLILSARSRRTT